MTRETRSPPREPCHGQEEALGRQPPRETNPVQRQLRRQAIYPRPARRRDGPEAEAVRGEAAGRAVAPPQGTAQTAAARYGRLAGRLPPGANLGGGGRRAA